LILSPEKIAQALIELVKPKNGMATN